MTHFKIAKAISTSAWWRIIKILLLAFTALLFVNIVFHNSSSKDSLSVFKAVMISVFFSEGIRFINLQLNKKLTWKQNPALRFTLQFGFDVTFVLFFVLGIKMIILIHFQQMSWQQFFHQELFVNWAIIFITLIVVLSDLGIFLIRQWRHSITELEVSKRRAAEFQFEMLRNQVNPHFLFNSLNTLDSLIFEDQKKASQFTRQLAHVYRNILELENSEMITLTEELKAIDAYISLIRIRFGENLKININIREADLDSLIPCLTTQLLIENAINHNIISSKKQLAIDIFSDNGYLVVKNNLQLKPQPLISTGIGLKNIENRYRLFGNHLITIKKNGTNFFVTLPLIRHI